MGCIGSKSDINDRHPNIFQVTNINEEGRKKKSGKLQVSDNDLVFYQRGKKPHKWPLRSLRKYGFDTEVFSFECGRRCPTGHGIYAFKCKKAELIFNLVQQHITAEETLKTDLLLNSGMANLDNRVLLINQSLASAPQTLPEASVTSLSQRSTACNVTEEYINQGEFVITSGHVLVSRRPNSNSNFQPQTEGYLNPVSIPVSRSLTETSRSGSVGSNGPLSPSISSPPPEISDVQNDIKRDSLTPDPTYTNSIIQENGLMHPEYANVDKNEILDDALSSSHLYMNVDLPKSLPREVEENHCYANIHTDRDLVEKFMPSENTALILCASCDQSSVEEVNYAELDLNGYEHNTQKISQVASVDPNVKGKYSTIDFQKTTALSQSKNPSTTVEEGSRKTRHNSTINYHSSISD